jgi:hypothetical protein
MEYGHQISEQENNFTKKCVTSYCSSFSLCHPLLLFSSNCSLNFIIYPVNVYTIPFYLCIPLFSGILIVHLHATTMWFQNTGNQIPSAPVLYPRRTDTLGILLWKPKISHVLLLFSCGPFTEYEISVSHSNADEFPCLLGVLPCWM